MEENKREYQGATIRELILVAGQSIYVKVFAAMNYLIWGLNYEYKNKEDFSL